ncbi:hypothetical protein Taro_049134 [Colocasia esculenta]|uniref:Aminotransferase-like plant mobile domain-containing protein n=1 Tax=Colocasia esculenta TaxID=4460 RepID=A0A843XA57_COLES|nr:hypothetical protein [Colocasia esculenta]
MEGDGGGQGGEGGGRRRKKMIRRRQAGEGTSTAAPDPPPVVPMEEEIAPAVGDEDELVGPKKSELRSRLGWAVIRAIYDGLPDFQALKERWDPECNAFLFSWGHMVPTLEDVVRITGLRVDGRAVTGTTYTSYQEPVERLLGLELRGERSSQVQRTVLQASLGVVSARLQTGEGQAEHMERMTDDARAAMAEEEGEAADRDLRRFLTLVIGKMILGTRGDPVGCRFLPLLEDLSSVGNYAWGAALLAHLFDSLGTSSRETGVAGFFPLLQVRWTPYVGEDDATQPWVERGRPYFSRDIWLHCFNIVVPLHHRLVTDWTVRVREQLDDWERRGTEVVSEATSDEDYFRAYARKYGAQVYKGSRRPLDPEGRISSLEGILHSTIQQRDDLQAVVDQLRAELDRAQQMVGGASSSREDPGRSVLEGQLASAAARAEDALAQLQEREQELRTALARTTTLEAEMAELRLRLEAAEVARWRQEAEVAARWQEEAAEATRWRQEAEEAA